MARSTDGERRGTGTVRHLIHRPRSWLHPVPPGPDVEEEFVLAGALPAGHPLFNDGPGRHHDLQATAEMVREAGEFIGHTHFGVPSARVGIFYRFDLRAGDLTHWRVGRAAKPSSTWSCGCAPTKWSTTCRGYWTSSSRRASTTCRAGAGRRAWCSWRPRCTAVTGSAPARRCSRRPGARGPAACRTPRSPPATWGAAPPATFCCTARKHRATDGCPRRCGCLRPGRRGPRRVTPPPPMCCWRRCARPRCWQPGTPTP